jgi:hypothetical protein
MHILFSLKRRSPYLFSFFTIAFVFLFSCTQEDVSLLGVESEPVLKEFSSTGPYQITFNFNEDGKVLEGITNTARHTFTYTPSHKLMIKEVSYWAFSETSHYSYTGDILNSIAYTHVNDIGTVVRNTTLFTYQGNSVIRETYDENGAIVLSEKLQFLSPSYTYLVRHELDYKNGSVSIIDFEYDENNNLIKGIYEKLVNSTREFIYEYFLTYDSSPNPFKSTMTYESQLYKDVVLFYEPGPDPKLNKAIKWSTNNVTSISVFKDGSLTPETIFTFDISYNNQMLPIEKRISQSSLPNTHLTYEYSYY